VTRARSSCRISSACALPEIDFAGCRCVHTHLRGEELTRDDLTDLALLRLDLMAAIDVDEETGLPGVVRSAHLLPSMPSAGATNGNSKHSLSSIPQWPRSWMSISRFDRGAGK